MKTLCEYCGPKTRTGQLNLLPSNERLKDLIGRNVFDSRGLKVGSVWKIKSLASDNTPVSIVVSRNNGKDYLDISREQIAHVDSEILLNAPLEEIIMQIRTRHKRGEEGLI